MNCQDFRNISRWFWLPGVSAALAAEPGGRNGRSQALPMDDANATVMSDIHDIKPALAAGPDLQWLYWALAFVMVSVLAILAWRIWRKRQTPGAPEMAAAMIPAEMEAYQMLDSLAADGNQDPKSFYFRLSAILRRYIERRFEIPAVEMTTEELLPTVARLPLRNELVQSLKAFCRATDPIKFAGAAAERHRMANDLVFARNFVRQTPAQVEPAINSETQTPPAGSLGNNDLKQLPPNRTDLSAQRRMDG